jgi:predicted nucleic acid-binding protein
LIDALLGDIRVGQRITGPELHAPVTVDAEVLHGLRRAVYSGALDPLVADSVVQGFLRTVIERHAVRPFVARMWAMRRNITAYDAGYVALAESLNLPLITRDRRLSNSSGHAARIEYID